MTKYFKLYQEWHQLKIKEAIKSILKQMIKMVEQ